MTEQPKRGGIGVLATIGTFHFAMYIAIVLFVDRSPQPAEAPLRPMTAEEVAQSESPI